MIDELRLRTGPASLDARVLLVHERLTEAGGSEAVVASLARLCPRSTLFVPIADPDVDVGGLGHLPRRTSPLQRLYRRGSYAPVLPLLPAAMRYARLPTAEADVVITSHHAFAQRVQVPADVPLISYVHTPARWMWQPGMRAGEAGRLGGAALSAFAATQRGADRRAAARVDVLLANSTAVATRVRRWWGRDAEVVFPPVDIEAFTPSDTAVRDDFFLLAGRLVPYKRPEVAVAAARRAGVRLVVVGEGRQRAECERVAGRHVTFLGRVTDAELRDLYRRCRALVFPGHEDFGIVPVEAQACGAPVIALGVGGARDTVLPGRTGVLIRPGSDHDEDVARFAVALAQFDPTAFDSAAIRRHAETFSEAAFHERMTTVIRSVVGLPLELAPLG